MAAILFSTTILCQAHKMDFQLQRPYCPHQKAQQSRSLICDWPD
jgi:nitrite reductase/ring-hydroxylating ferredoxin subunit